jgi:hypothetical protein
MGAVLARILRMLWRTILVDLLRRMITALCRRHRRQ